ncbi:hypothetical protein C1H46_041955 [Malus baccata]|uniref:Uncharacterized protein n=1 Tax=Malus baccata TaxID=106549 RepID=A0A540KE58_MALBA|nr:hypothetical protein C1H46_041955 [Malus baccata]
MRVISKLKFKVTLVFVRVRDGCGLWRSQVHRQGELVTGKESGELRWFARVEVVVARCSRLGVGDGRGRIRGVRVRKMRADLGSRSWHPGGGNGGSSMSQRRGGGVPGE